MKPEANRKVVLVRFIDFQKPLNRIMVQAGVVIGIIWLFAHYFSNIAAYLIISLILSAVLSPIVNAFGNLQLFGKRLPRLLAVLFGFAFLLSAITTFFILFVPIIYDQLKLIQGLNFERLLSSVRKPLWYMEGFFQDKLNLSVEQGALYAELQAFVFRLLSSVEISNLFNSLLNITSQAAIGLLAVFFITFFFLYERSLFKNLIIELIPNRYFEVGITTLHKIERLLSNYLLGILVQITAIFSLISIGLSIFNIPYAMTIALFTALANLIPYLGPILGGAFGLLVGISSLLLQGDAVGQPLYWLVIKILSVFAITQLIDNLILQPVIFSRSVRSHPLVIFLTVFIGANLGGAIGMILAIPSYTVLQVIFTELRQGIYQYQVFRKERAVRLYGDRTASS